MNRIEYVNKIEDCVNDTDTTLYFIFFLHPIDIVCS